MADSGNVLVVAHYAMSSEAALPISTARLSIFYAVIRQLWGERIPQSLRDLESSELRS